MFAALLNYRKKGAMTAILKILFVKDSPEDAELAQLVLAREGIDLNSHIVENEKEHPVV